jgi:hypothetical protein
LREDWLRVKGAPYSSTDPAAGPVLTLVSYISPMLSLAAQFFGSPVLAIWVNRVWTLPRTTSGGLLASTAWKFFRAES